MPLFLAAHGRPPREAFWLGYAWGAIALGGVLWWLATFGLAIWTLAVILVGVFPALAVAGAAALRQGREGPAAPLVAAMVWTAVEFCRSRGPLGFPWALLGESQHRALVVAQVASVAGVYGVGFLVVLVNATLAHLIRFRRASLPSCAVAAACMAAATAWGHAALAAPAGPRLAGGAPTRAFIAAVVQPDYAARVTWDPGRASRDLVTLGRLTHEAASRGAALVVWPETASPTDIAGDPATRRLLSAWARDGRIALIASSLEGGRTNSAFSFAPDGLLVGRYDKMRLVPFAEFGERAGHGPAVLPTPRAALGMAICFESTFPEIARQAVAHGASLLAVVTNDAWFDGRVAPLQHAAIAPFRAIEQGRYLLRAANSGPSEIIDPRGRVIATLPLGARGVLTAPVVPLDGRTPYGRLGDVFGWGAVLLSGVLLLPPARDWGTAQARAPAFRRLVVVSTLPLAAAAAAAALRAAGVPDPAIGGAPLPLPALAVLAAAALLTRDRAREIGRGTAGFLPAALGGLAAVAAFAAVAARAFAAHGLPPALVPPPGGWALGTAVQIVIVGLAQEWWLRGLVFAAAAGWKGGAAALVWSALLGMAAASVRGPETMVWALFSGAVFGLIRLRWTQVPALALAHGAGRVLLGFLLSSW